MGTVSFNTLNLIPVNIHANMKIPKKIIFVTNIEFILSVILADQMYCKYCKYCKY